VETGIKSREQARHRLRQVLVHDRAMLSPALLDELKEVLFLAAQEFVDSDNDAAVLELEIRPEGALLHFKLPIKGLVRQEELPIV